MLNISKIRDLIPEKGRLTITLTKRKKGNLSIVWAPFFDGIPNAHTQLINRPIPRTGTVEEIQVFIENEVMSVMKEAADIVSALAIQKPPKPKNRADSIREERERLINGSSSPTQTANTEIVARKKRGRQVKGLTEQEKSYLHLLKEKDRSVLTARFIENKSLQDIADSSGRTRQAVASHVSSARSRLEKAMLNPSSAPQIAKSRTRRKYSNAGFSKVSDGGDEIVCSKCEKQYITTLSQPGSVSVCPYCSHNNIIPGDNNQVTKEGTDE